MSDLDNFIANLSDEAKWKSSKISLFIAEKNYDFINIVLLGKFYLILMRKTEETRNFEDACANKYLAKHRTNQVFVECIVDVDSFEYQDRITFDKIDYIAGKIAYSETQFDNIEYFLSIEACVRSTIFKTSRNSSLIEYNNDNGTYKLRPYIEAEPLTEKEEQNQNYEIFTMFSQYEQRLHVKIVNMISKLVVIDLQTKWDSLGLNIVYDNDNKQYYILVIRRPKIELSNIVNKYFVRYETDTPYVIAVIEMRYMELVSDKITYLDNSFETGKVTEARSVKYFLNVESCIWHNLHTGYDPKYIDFRNGYMGKL